MTGLKGVKVLVIEDIEDLLEFHRRWLTQRGAVFVGSLDGQGGIEKLRENLDISVVVLDMVLPDISGHAVFEELRRLKPDIPVVICTGYANLIEEYKGKHNVEGIHKPFQLPVLEAAILAMCGKTKPSGGSSSESKSNRD